MQKSEEHKVREDSKNRSQKDEDRLNDKRKFNDDLNAEGFAELDNEEEIEEPWHKGPVRIILALFLVMMIILMVVPYHAVNLDPEPSDILKLDEVRVERVLGNSTNKVDSIDDLLDYINGDDTVIKNAATKIVAHGCSGNDDVCKAKALFYFTRDNIKYVSDPVATEYVQEARDVLFTGGGDCDDKAVLLGSMMDAVGLRQRLVFVKGHVYNQAYLPEVLSRYKDEEGWVNMDAACEGCRFGEIMAGVADKEKRIIG